MGAWNTRRAIVAFSRVLLEICYLRDQWDNHGVGNCNLPGTRAADQRVALTSLRNTGQ